MSVKRRGFLQMLTGALAAPLMPSASFGAATKAAYPASALHAAIYHAQSRVNFSVFALAHKLGLSLDQAEALMSDMSARGILGPLQGTTQSGRWALSKVWERPFVDAAAAHKTAQARAKTGKSDIDLPEQSPRSGVDLRPMMKHLHGLCRARGMALHPRCLEAI